MECSSCSKINPMILYLTEVLKEPLEDHIQRVQGEYDKMKEIPEFIEKYPTVVYYAADWRKLNVKQLKILNKIVKGCVTSRTVNPEGARHSDEIREKLEKGDWSNRKCFSMQALTLLGAAGLVLLKNTVLKKQLGWLN